MIAAGLLCFGLTHSCRLMKQAEVEQGWPKRLVEAPGGAYLAIEVKLKHEGERIEGVGRHYTRTGMAWGHRFTTSSLVFTAGQDPYRLRSDAAPSVRKATTDYPHLTPSEALLNVVGEVLVSGYELKGGLVNAESSKLTPRSLPPFPVASIGRFSNTKVSYRGQTLQAKALAEAFRPGPARYDRKLGRYAKRMGVYLPDVGQIELIFIWYAHTFDWNSILVSPLQAGLQELIKACKARWALAVIHRTLRQNLALAQCQCFAFIVAKTRPKGSRHCQDISLLSRL